MYNTKTNYPSAWIVSSNDKGRKKIYLNSKVYLDNNQTFEIEVFNPTQDSVLTEIKINGKIATANGLILKPGQRCFLDCFIDDKRKFIFKTYEVENSKEALNAISNNGCVDVSFYKEKINYHNQIYYQAYNMNLNYYNNLPVFNTTTFTVADGLTTCYNMTNLSNSTSRNIETGRIEKGDLSNQSFENVCMNFETYCMNKVSYQILPNSKKPVEVAEIKNVNCCSHCGFKFCPTCGSKI